MPPHHSPPLPLPHQIDTTMGSFTVELYYKHAPRTVDNFVKLSDKGYYDGTVFHRIIRDFSEWGRGTLGEGALGQGGARPGCGGGERGQWGVRGVWGWGGPRIRR